MDRTTSSPRRRVGDSLDADDPLGAFQDSLQSFPPEHAAATARITLPLSGGNIPHHDTLADRAIGVLVAIVALALIAGAVYLGLE